MKPWIVVSLVDGTLKVERTWQADDDDHAREQHEDAFPDEEILDSFPKKRKKR